MQEFTTEITCYYKKNVLRIYIFLKKKIKKRTLCILDVNPYVHTSLFFKIKVI